MRERTWVLTSVSTFQRYVKPLHAKHDDGSSSNSHLAKALQLNMACMPQPPPSNEMHIMPFGEHHT